MKGQTYLLSCVSLHCTVAWRSGAIWPCVLSSALYHHWTRGHIICVQWIGFHLFVCASFGFGPHNYWVWLEMRMAPTSFTTKSFHGCFLHRTMNLILPTTWMRRLKCFPLPITKRCIIHTNFLTLSKYI